VALHTVSIHDGDTRYILFDEHVYNIHNRRVHRCCCEVVICAVVHHFRQRLSQLLRFFDIHSDELEYAVLCYDTDHHGPLCLVVAVDDGYASRTRFEHLATCFVDWAVGVDGDSFNGLDAKRFLDLWERLLGLPLERARSRFTSKAVQAELVYPSQSIGVLPVVLDDIDIVRGRQ
jgi:hypothetical protein